MIRIATVVLVLGFAGAPVAGRSPTAERRLTPDLASMGPPFEVHGSAVSLESRGVLLRVQPLDEARRGSYFALRTALGRDPFPDRSEAPEGYTVFEVSLRNRSGRQLSYAPGLTQCFLDRDRELRRVEMDQALGILRLAVKDSPEPDQAAVDHLAAFHVSPLILEDGETASRVLAFRGQATRTGRLRLDLELVVGDEELRPHFQFTVLGLPGSR